MYAVCCVDVSCAATAVTAAAGASATVISTLTEPALSTTVTVEAGTPRSATTLFIISVEIEVLSASDKSVNVMPVIVKEISIVLVVTVAFTPGGGAGAVPSSKINVELVSLSASRILEKSS